MKTENRPKTSLNSSHTNALSQGTIFAKNANFLQEKKNVDMQNQEGLGTKRYIVS